MCASANSLIGPNFKPMFTCTDAIVHQFHAVNAWHRNCYLSTEFCDFWLQSMAFYIDNLFQVASVDSMQNFLPFFHWILLLFLHNFSQSAFFFYLFGCLLSLSSICSRNIRICNNKWLLDSKKRSTVRAYYLVALNCCLQTQNDGAW